MTRSEAERAISDLYGANPEFVNQTLHEFGLAALTDQAVIRIAQLQKQQERTLFAVAHRLDYEKSLVL